jgi:hypothetical protein
VTELDSSAKPTVVAHSAAEEAEHNEAQAAIPQDASAVGAPAVAPSGVRAALRVPELPFS